ncbi:uncharacterized protein LOC143185993 [Calliopsis andreniformis]|uniref:uncharacterized protein LOC143185993 n=1 Tax=Calliopsis andreniformis TaxID=337506 RepID=UPI003FCC846C
MSCEPLREIVPRRSTLPPLCPPCHRKPPQYCCPKYGCPPIQECPRRRCCCPPPPRLMCRERPRSPPPLPTLCLPAPCPSPPQPIPYPCCPPKIQPPASCVRFCIRTTCGQSTYDPCYFADVPCCPPPNIC